MRAATKQHKDRKEIERIDPAARLAATDEILQVMYWLRGENIAQEVAPNDLARWIGLEVTQIEPLMTQLLGARLLERVVVDSGTEEGVPRFRLTQAGVQEGDGDSRRNSLISPSHVTSSTAIRSATAKTFRVLAFR